MSEVVKRAQELYRHLPSHVRSKAEHRDWWELSKLVAATEAGLYPRAGIQEVNKEQ